MNEDRQKKMVSATIIMIIIYLASSLLLYDMILAPQMNKMTGKAVSMVNVSQSPPEICDFMLYQGENLISFHCIHGAYPKDYLLQNISQDYDAIFTYTITDIQDNWKSYNPSLPEWAVQDLSMINDYQGVWIIMNKNKNFDFEGIDSRNTQMQLYTGWNLIGYPRATAMAPNLAFASLAGNYNKVLQYKKSTNTWYYYSPGDPFSTLSVIEPDYGYWIYMTSDDAWVYP